MIPVQPDSSRFMPQAAAGSSPASVLPASIDGPLYVDTHVHIYRAFDPARLLDAAVRNVRGHGREPGAMPVLMLTECRADHVFARWRDIGQLGAWRFVAPEPTPGERNPVLFGFHEDETRPSLALVAGRQIITKQRIEVLALGTDETLPDGHDLDETIADVRGRGALPVVPYGFGKWTGTRGAAVSRLIEAQSRQGEAKLVLGDNGGRPTFGPRPPHFDQAAAHRVTILPGTDPLPLRSCQRQAGRFGVRIEGPLPTASFVTELLAKLADLGPVPPRFGDHVSLLRAVYQQVALRIDRKLLGGKGRL